MYPRTYHDYAKSLGTKFTKPDLAIAFNSGCSQEAVSSWKETIIFLSQNNIPSVFTVGYFLISLVLYLNKFQLTRLIIVKKLKRRPQSSLALASN